MNLCIYISGIEDVFLNNDLIEHYTYTMSCNKSMYECLIGKSYLQFIRGIPS